MKRMNGWAASYELTTTRSENSTIGGDVTVTWVKSRRSRTKHGRVARYYAWLDQVRSRYVGMQGRGAVQVVTYGVDQS